MPSENMMRVFHIDDGENVNSYTVRDSHINLGYVTCSTAASTAAKEASFSEDIGWKLRAGSSIIVKFTYAVPANATLNVASTGAKDVYHKGANVTSGVIKAGDIVTFIYDGTNYVITAIDRIMSGVFGEMSASDVAAALGYTPLNSALKGVSNGVAELDSGGKVPASQLPSYVDDVLEYNSLSAFPSTGEDGKIYIAADTNKSYRWSGSAYAAIAGDLTLGETSATAYRGDRGKTAYDHASAKGSAYASGMYKITTNSEGHVTAATAVAKSDITNLGIKPTQTAVTSPSASGTDVEFIDTIAQDTNGVITPTKKTVRTFSGATSSANGSAGLVVAPSAGEEEKVLTGAGTWQYITAASKTYVLDTVTNTSGSYTHDTTFSDVTSDMKAIKLDLGNPEAFMDKINIYCQNGYITLACNNVVGTSTVSVTVLKQAHGNGLEITSDEFDVIANRVGTLSNLNTSVKTDTVSAINELDNDLGSPSSASAVTGSDAFAKIATLNSEIGTVPSGETVEGQISTINGKIGTVPSGETVEGQISTLNGNITTINDKIATDSVSLANSESLLTWLTNNVFGGKKAYPYTFVKTGAGLPSDVPFSTEFTGVIEGNGARLNVTITTYVNSGKTQYTRAIFNGSWYGDWVLSGKINNKFAWTTFLSASNVSVGNTYASTGKSFTLTAPAIVQAGMSYGSGRPLAIGLKNSESIGSASVALTSVVASDISDTSGLTVTAILPAGTYYVWARTASASGSTTLSVQGMPLGA